MAQAKDTEDDHEEDESSDDEMEPLYPRLMEQVEQEAYEHVTKAKTLAITKTYHKFAKKKKKPSLSLDD